MCIFCHTKLLAHAIMDNEQAKCPVCRDRVDNNHLRCLLAQSVLAELVTECPACGEEVKRGELAQHQANKCSERYVLYLLCSSI